MNLEERVLTIPEAAELLRVGVRTYYAAASRGEVPAIRIGRRLVVPGAALARLLAEEVIGGAGHAADGKTETTQSPRPESRAPSPVRRTT